MSETIHLSTSHLKDADLKAIAVYLKDQPQRQESASSDPDPAATKVGGQIYEDECSGCHTASGKGIPRMFPSLSGAPGVQQRDPTSLLRVVGKSAPPVSGAEVAKARAAFVQRSD